MVVGDVIVDKYTYGKRLGISAETPTVVAEYDGQKTFMGGAGLVVRHLLRLGCEVTFVTACDKQYGVHGMFMSPDNGLSEDELSRLHVKQFPFQNWILTRKERYYVDDYKMVQYDVLNRSKWDPVTADAFVKYVEALLSGIDAVILADNRHGVLSYGVGCEIVGRSRRLEIPSFVDSQVSQSKSNLDEYVGCTYVFMNERELRGYGVFCPEMSVAMNVDYIEKELGTTVVLKLGDKGSMIHGHHVPAYPVAALDTCGAGDGFLAAFVQSSGDMIFANKWAARSTLYKGTIVPSLEETV